MRELLKALLTGESRILASDLLARNDRNTGRTGFAWEAAQSDRVVIGPNTGCVPRPDPRRGVYGSVSDGQVGSGKGWMALGGDGFDAIGGNLDLAVDDYLAHNVNYLRVILGVKLPPLDHLPWRH